MSGSKHEKIIITVVAYIIGLNTAFIAFGLNEASINGSIPYDVDVTTQKENVQTQTDSEVSIISDDSGLYIRTPNGEKLLSASRSSLLPANAILSTETSGIYYAIIDAELSRDGKFVYFCEQLAKNIEECDPYVYDIAQDFLVRVTVDGETYSSNIYKHTSSWTKDNLLTLNSYISSSAEYPWALVQQ